MFEREQRTAKIKNLSLEAGFDRVGVAGAGPFKESEHFQSWLTKGYHGEMHYLAKDPERRSDVRQVRDWVRSVIVCAVDYHTDFPLSTDVTPEDNRGWISRYAWGDDYHDVLEGRLKAFVHAMERDPDVGGQHRYYVDHGPVLEKVVALHAGLGWMGKNSLVIDPQRGSFFFLAVVLTDLELEPDGVVADHCGSCTRCLDACPTDAFPEPYVLDARRCISYLTIESKQDIPADLREGVGHHVFGCDICQDVCPWNSKASTTDDSAFLPREGFVQPFLGEFLEMDDAGFRERFRKSPVKRRKREGFQWNVRAAAQNMEAQGPEDEEL
jgi:epoxyqueuosine reductase